MKKCGYFYSINNSKYKIFNDFLMCFFYTVIFNLRILKRNIINDCKINQIKISLKILIKLLVYYFLRWR